MSSKAIPPFLGRAVIVALLAVTLTGSNSPVVPSAASEMCVSAVSAPAAIQAIIDARDGCAAMTDLPYAGNPRALFQHVDAGGAEVLEWQPGQIVQFTGELAGTYKVVAEDWVVYGSAKAYPDLGTDIVFQTCSWDEDGGSGLMRVVGLNRVA